MTTQTATSDAVRLAIHDTADRLERQEDWGTTRDLRHWGAGGLVFTSLYESARQTVGWPAVEHMQRVLRLEQLQHWQENDKQAIVAKLREAAATPVETDVEAAAARKERDDLCRRISKALGYADTDNSTHYLAEAVEARLADMARQITKLEADLAEAKKPKPQPKAA